MAVIERGALRILSKQDLAELERDVTTQEKLAERSDIASSKIRSSSTGPALPRATTRKQSKQLELGLSGGRGEQSALFQKQKLPGKINKVQALERRLILQEKATKGITQGLSKFGLLGNAAGGNAGRVFFSKGLASAAKVFLPAAVVITIAETALQLWVDSYGKGGNNDPRKPVKDDVVSIVNLQFDEQIISAKQYFANSRTLKPGQETRSNTENLKDGHNRSRLNRVSYGR